MSFNVALSGLRAANQDLATTGNNIANASTTGFKKSRAEFADVYAGSIMGNGSRTPGSGVLVGAIAQQFGQGNISITNNSLDLAISGEGFFTLSDGGSPVYTRSGIFGLDKDGYIVGNSGAKLQGYRASENGAEIISGAISDLRIQTADIEPAQTKQVNITFNLDSDSTTRGWGSLVGSQPPTTTDFGAVPGTPASFVGTVDATGGVDLTTNNEFQISGPGVASPVTVTVDPQIYSDPEELAAAINVGLGNAGAGSRIQAFANGNSIELQEIEGESGTDILVTAAPQNDASAAIFGSTLGSNNADPSDAGPNRSFAVRIGSGPVQTVLLDQDYVNINEMAEAIQGKLTDVDVTVSGGVLALSPSGDSQGGEIFLGGSADEIFGAAPLQGRLAFDHTSPGTYNWSTAATVYDSLGNSHVLSTYYRKESDNTWTVYGALDQQDPLEMGQLAFNPSGSLSGPPRLELPNQDVGGGASPLGFTVDFTNSTQFGSEFSVNALNQDGYAPGRLAGLDIDDTGVVFARYTNGKGLKLGQVALANFSNPQGLSPVGNTMWAESFDSGQPVVGAPQTASLGSIQSGALEDSNVDLSDELVNLIIAQRNYQANAKTIETANAVTQSIINLR